VHDGTLQSRFEDQLEQLGDRTGRYFVFGKSFDSYGGSYGNAILSRERVVSSKVYHLPGRGEPRSLLEATVIVDGMPVNIYVTHLASWGRLHRGSRSAQIDCIVEIIRRSPHPFVLMGDFNTTPGNPEITPLTSGALVRQSLNPSDATHILTQQHIDYIFPDSGWQTISAGVIRTGPSDHWPVVATLATGSMTGSP
jgi:endonuclease/exonuclease/phosphatase family metal-dependent hydrolase